MIELKSTSRGLIRGEFLDRYGQQCSLQESSHPEETCIWFGVDVDQNGNEVNKHMHLTRKQVHDLLPILRRFVRTGALGYDNPKEEFQVGTWVIGVGDTNRGVEGRVVEVVVGQYLTVQNEREAGEMGQIVCLWDKVDLVWEVREPPEVGPSRYERLLQDNDLVDEPV